VETNEIEDYETASEGYEGDRNEDETDEDGDELEQWIISGGVAAGTAALAVGSWALMQRRRWNRKFTGRDSSK
jgi:hypothetical protein